MKFLARLLYLLIGICMYNNANTQTISTFITTNDVGYLVFDGSGNLYISNNSENTITKITPQGNASIFANTLLNGPQGLAFDGSGNLYVANVKNNTVTKITPQGYASYFVNTLLSNPVGLAFDGSGNLYVANAGNNTVTKVTPQGYTSYFVNTLLSTPEGLAFDGSGYLYVANAGNNTVTKVSPQGYTSIFVNTLLSSPRGLAYDGSGNLYVTNVGSNSITKVSPQGYTSIIVNTLLSSPLGLEFNASGNLYVANNGNNTISKISFTPSIVLKGSLTNFNTCASNASTVQTFTIFGTNLSAGITINAPAGFEISADGKFFNSSITLQQTASIIATSTIYVRLSSTSSGTPSGNISITSAGATTQNIAVSGTVNAIPAIILGTITGVNNTATSFNIPYTAITGNPNQYSITTGASVMGGFTAVNKAVLSSSPINVSIPTSTANTYNFNLTVNNSTTGCVSAPLPFNVVVAAAVPVMNSISPVSGPVGTLVTITGTNLNNPTAITIGGVSAIPISNTGSSLVAMVMPGAKTGSVSVTTSGGTVNGSNFTVTATKYPSVQQGGKLVGTGAISSTHEVDQGWSVSISADGNTAIVGGPYDNNKVGAVWIYTRNNGTWTQQGAKLVGSGYIGASFQGNSVSISADGNTAIVGGLGDNNNEGAVWVFIRSNGIWTQQGNKLVGSGAIGSSAQGRSVSLSADGNTVVIGGIDDNNNTGAVWVFIRSNGIWSQQGSKLVGTGAIGNAIQGFSVAISSDGNTAIVGGIGDNNNEGAVWIYTRYNGIWAQQGNKLVGTGGSFAKQGSSVSISADGNTAIVGGEDDNNTVGAVWVFNRSNGLWIQQGNKLVGLGALGQAYQGVSVSISADGNTAIVGGVADNNNTGAVWNYTRSQGVWTQQGVKLVGSGASGNAWQGQSVAISADGETAIEGGIFDNPDNYPNTNKTIGAAWIFTTGTTTPSLTTTGTLIAFNSCTGTPSTPQNFTVSGSNLTGNIILTAPAGYELSNSATGKYAAADTLAATGGSVATSIVYIRLSATATGTPSGNISIASAGATTQNIAVSGNLNAIPSITLGTITSVNTTATSFNIPYTATTGNPNQYSITTGTSAMGGFTAVNKAVLSSSPINVSIPTCTANAYNFNLTVNNSTTGCVSAPLPFNVVVTATTNTQIITTIAGNYNKGAGYSGDGGPAINAQFYGPQSVTVDGAGNYFIADQYNNRIRKVTSNTGIISTIAGNGNNGYTGNGGIAVQAQLSNPNGITLDLSGNIYITDFLNQVVRKIDHVTGIITTVAGIGSSGGYSGDGGPATSAQLYFPSNITVDVSGNIYIVDASNNVIRKVNYSTGKISTVAGNGSHGFSGDGGPATSAQLNYPLGIAVDKNGNIYIADNNNNVIREVNYVTGKINSIVGNYSKGGGYSGDGGLATNAQISQPMGITLDSIGNLYIAEAGNNVIRKYNPVSGVINTVAGNGKSGYSGDGGLASNANLNNPQGVAVDKSGNLFIADRGNNVIRKVNNLNSLLASISVKSVSITNFNSCTGTPSTPQNFTVSGNNLTGNIILTAPAGYELSNSATGKFSVTDTLAATGGTVATSTVYTRLSATATGTPLGNISITSAGATTQTIAVSGTVNALPTAPVITNSRPLNFCNGDSTVLTSSVTTGIQWQLNNTNITGATGTKITAKQSGAYTVVTTNSNGCSAVSAITTVKNNPIPGAPLISTSGNATAFCSGSYLVLSSDSTSGNQWYYNGTAVTTAKGVNDTARAAGNYALQYTSSAGCVSPMSTSKAITVNALPSIPTITSNVSTSFCQGLYDILSSSSSTGNQWKLNGTAIAKASTLQNFVANIAGNYTVTVSNAAGCTATSTATAITILPTPAKPVITEDANLNLVSSATKGNQWYSPELLTGDTGKVYTPWVNGTYYVQVTVGGCISPMSDVYVYNNPNLNKESLRATGTSTLDSKAVQLYPNPVSSTLKINYQISGIQNVTAEVVDMNGNIIARKESITSGSSIDVSGYASGMYIIRLVNAENKEVLYTTKVIKAK